MVTPPETTDTSPIYTNIKGPYEDENGVINTYTSDSEDGAPIDEMPEPTRVRFRNPNRQVGTAYFDYKAKETDELSLKRGSVVEIIKAHCGEDGWMIARVNNHEGMVPKNYVALVGEQPTVVDYTRIRTTSDCVGTGGFADVYRGRYDNEEVALKVPRHSTDMTNKVREALEREALILCRLKHRNIIGFIGISLRPMLLVLELCEGGSLFSLCRRMKVAHMPTSIKWARQVASAMHHLHDRDDPLVHADLKSENVLIKERPCECGIVGSSWRFSLHQYNLTGICQNCGGHRLDYLTMKVTDFGLSRSLKARRASLLLSGSVSWLAPEVIERKIYSTHSDIWAYGVFMWEIFSCKIPFLNYDHNVITFAIARGKKTLPLPEDCPEGLRAIFRSCWDQDPIQRSRFPRVLQMLDILEKNDDFSFGWNFEDYDVCTQKSQSPFEETLSYAEIHRQFKDGKLADFLWNTKKQIGPALRLLEAQAPVVKPRKQGKLRSRFAKNDIGRPSDFRHNVSVRPSGEDTTQKSEFVIKYDEIEKTNDFAPPRRHGVSDTVKAPNSGGYTLLSSLASSVGAENHVLFNFSDKTEKKPTPKPTINSGHYVRLPPGTTSSRYRRPSPDPSNRHESGSRRTDDSRLATLADVYAAKSKSNPDLVNGDYDRIDEIDRLFDGPPSSDDEEDVNSEVDESLQMAASHMKQLSSSSAPAANQLNRKAEGGYVVLKNRNEPFRSFENNLEEVSFGDVDSNADGSANIAENDDESTNCQSAFYNKPNYSGYDNVSIDVPQRPSYSTIDTADEVEPDSDTTKTRSLGRTNAFRRKVTGSQTQVYAHNSTVTPKAKPTELAVGMALTPETPEHCGFDEGRTQKESSTSLPATLPVIQMDLVATDCVTNSAPMLSRPTNLGKGKDNQNYPPPWLVQNNSSEGSPSDSGSGNRSQSLLPTPRQQTPADGTPATARAKSPSPIGARRRKVSGSTFYLDDPTDGSVLDSDLPSTATPRRRSGNHKLGQIFSKMTNMFGGRSTSGADSSDLSDSLPMCNESTDANDSADVIGLGQQTTNAPSNQRAFKKLHDYPDRQRRRPRKESIDTSGTTTPLSSGYRLIYGSRGASGTTSPSSPVGEPRSFPPASETLTVGRPSSNTVTAVTPSSGQPRISFNTVIELQSPCKSQASTQFRPQSHIAGSSSHSSHRQPHNDILSRPIQSVNDLRQQSIAKTPTLPPTASLPMGLLAPNICSSGASTSSTNLSLDDGTISGGLATIHQRSKSTDGNLLVSTISPSSSSRTASMSTSIVNGYHSLQRPKINETNDLSSSASQHGTGFNRTYVSMFSGAGKGNTVAQNREVNDVGSRRVSEDGTINSDSNPTQTKFMEADAPPIPRKKNASLSTAYSKPSTSSKSTVNIEIASNLRAPTSTAPVLRMPTDPPLMHRHEPHHSYYHQIRLTGVPTDGRKQQRPTTLNLNGRRVSNQSNGPIMEDPAQSRVRFVKEFSVVPPDAVVPVPPSMPVPIPPRANRQMNASQIFRYIQPPMSRAPPRLFNCADSEDFEFVFDDASMASPSILSTSSSGIATSAGSLAAHESHAIPRGYVVIPRSLGDKTDRQNGPLAAKATTTNTMFPTKQQTSYGHESSVVGRVPKIPLKLNTNAHRK